MHRVEFHKRVIKALRRIPENRAWQIISAIDELANTSDPTTHSDVKMMQGKWNGTLRLRAGTYRVIFKLIDDDHEQKISLIYITHIGTRGNIYR